MLGTMVLSMIFAGLASTMNIWVDSWDDVRFSLNDAYMIGLMTGWMIFFMGILEFQTTYMALGGLVAGLFFALIRTQAFVTERQYLQGMIPHHSMAILMSKRLAEKPNQIHGLLQSIVSTQQEEIQLMKRLLEN